MEAVQIFMRNRRLRKTRSPMFSRLVYTVILLLVIVSIAVCGRGDKAGSAAAPELLIPIGARMVGLSGSSVSMISGAEALFWNPAGVSRSAKPTNGIVSHMNYLADIRVDYIALTHTIGDLGAIGFSAKTILFGSIPITTEDSPDGTGDFASPSYYVFTGGFSREMTDHISFGFNGPYTIG